MIRTPLLYIGKPPADSHDTAVRCATVAQAVAVMKKGQLAVVPDTETADNVVAYFRAQFS